MKHITQLLTIAFFTSTVIFAQDKLKGNKEVTIEDRSISDFNKIEVIDNLEVILTYNESQSVKVETDSNLQDAVLTEVKNGVLTIKTSDRIVRKKALKVHVNINSKLNEIYGYNNCKIVSKSLLNIDTLTVNTFDNVAVNLKLTSKLTTINSKKTSNLTFEILSYQLIVRAEESSKIKATINTKESIIEVLDRATTVFDGTSPTMELTTQGNSTFKGRQLETSKAIVKASNSSSVFVNATNALDISAINTSEVYIYSNPKIEITEFFDKASIHKRLLDKKNF